MAVSKLMALLREAAQRTIPALWDTIDRPVDVITPQQIANFSAAAGYEPDQTEIALDGTFG